MPLESTKSDPGSAPHILIVDDEEFIRSSFQLYFETLGYKVSVADGGESALATFQKEWPRIDVVLLDLVMPGTHGIEVLRRLKDLDGSVEVIIATGCGSMNTAIQALRYGAFDYITKPIVNFEEDLLKVLEAALAARRARRSTPPPSIEGERNDVGTTGPSTPPLRFCLALEQMARELRSLACRGDRLRALGSFLTREFGAEAAVAFRVEEPGRVTCLGQGEDFDPSWSDGSKDLEPGIAATFAESLREDLLWERLSPTFVAGVRGLGWGTSGALEALRVPLGCAHAPAEPAGGAKLLLVRRSRPGAETAIPAPSLLSIVATAALEDDAHFTAPWPARAPVVSAALER